MAEKAQVTSIEALEAFRTSLILYVSKARPALEEISSDLLRTRVWLQDSQRLHWEKELRRREKELQQAEQALSSARLSGFRTDKSTEQNVVRKAKRALEDAQTKLKMLKHWNREIDHRAAPLAKQLEKLHTMLTTDMVEAAAYLSRAIATLAAYAEMTSASEPAPSAIPESDEGVKATAGTLTSDGDNEAPSLDEDNNGISQPGKP